jgi:murein tripeptide amidase MpaA
MQQHAAYFNLRQWGLDWWNDNDVRVSPEQFPKVSQFLSEATIPFTVMIEDVQKLIAREQAHTETTLAAERAGSNQLLTGMNGAPVPTFFSDYRKLADIWTFVDGLIQQYPNLAKKVNIGTSYENRTLSVLVLSSGKAKSSLYLEGGIHSREWVSHTTVLFTAWSILSGYGTEKNVTTLLDSFDVHINPVVNPDGYEFTW